MTFLVLLVFMSHSLNYHPTLSVIRLNISCTIRIDLVMLKVWKYSYQPNILVVTKCYNSQVPPQTIVTLCFHHFPYKSNTQATLSIVEGSHWKFIDFWIQVIYDNQYCAAPGLICYTSSSWPFSSSLCFYRIIQELNSSLFSPHAFRCWVLHYMTNWYNTSTVYTYFVCNFILGIKIVYHIGKKSTSTRIFIIKSITHLWYPNKSHLIRGDCIDCFDSIIGG